MPLEKINQFPKKEVIITKPHQDDLEMIDRISQKLQTVAVAETEGPGLPHELDPGKLRHKVHNNPRPLTTPKFSVDVSSDSVTPLKPQKTL